MRSRRTMTEMEMLTSADSRRGSSPCTKRAVGRLSRWMLPGLLMASLAAACEGEFPIDGIDPIDETTDLESDDSAMTKASWVFAHNAQVNGDFFYLRDVNGTKIPGRRVADGDNIVVLDVGHKSQLALVQYPTADGTNIGFISNVPSMIKYYSEDKWQNGSTPETVYDVNGNKIGLLNPREKATPLYKSPFNGMFHVVYDTSKGPNTKSGYVKYHGNYISFKNSPPTCTVTATGSGSSPQPTSSDPACKDVVNRLIELGKKIVDKLFKRCKAGMPILPYWILDKAILSGEEQCPVA